MCRNYYSFVQSMNTITAALFFQLELFESFIVSIVSNYHNHEINGRNPLENKKTNLLSSQWFSGLWDLWEVLADMVDFSHFADVRFLRFAASNFLLYTWYDVPYVYLADNAVELGYTEGDASYLISVIGIVNMFGEVSSQD